MSEIDKPGQQPTTPEDSGAAAEQGPRPEVSAQQESSPIQPAAAPGSVEPASQSSVPATPGEAPGEPAAPTNVYQQPVYPGYGQQPQSYGQQPYGQQTRAPQGPFAPQGPYGPYGQTASGQAASGQAAYAGSGAPVTGGYPSAGVPVSGPAGAPVSGGYPTAGAPVSGGYPATGAPMSGGYPTAGMPVGGPAGQTATQQYPHWTPPAAKPKGMPTFAKVAIGAVAAVALALCSGLTGAVVATQLDNGSGFELPVSNNAAPAVDRSTLSGVAAATQPSVVSISTGSGEGSGVIISKDGYIVTNNHVVESARGGNVTVTLSDGKKVKASVVGTDPKTDLAVVKATAATELSPAKLANSEQVKVGDTVLAIGSPLGLQGSVTSGIISAKDRIIRAGQSSSSLSGLLQTDAPINPGNSGGALVNTNGEVVGINTAIATSGNGEGNIGVGFAIPSNKAKQVSEQLINGQKVSHPYLGVSVEAVDEGGARVMQIAPNSPAAGAGLQVGDVVTKFGDKVVNDSDDLVSAVQSGTVGQKVTVEYTRNGQKQTATVTLGEAS